MAPGRKATRVALPQLRAARLRSGWTEGDLAAAVLDVAEALGEPEPRINAGQVSKWERGDRKPGLYYRTRLCIALECTPDHIGFPATPSLTRSIRTLTERAENSNRPSESDSGRDRGLVDFDVERLQTTLSHLWPVDQPLLDGLDRAARRFAHRRDTEPPSAVIADLRSNLDVLLELLSRSPRPDHARQLRRIAAGVGQNLAMAEWIAGNPSETYRAYAIAAELARDSRSGAQLALILVDRSEMAGQRAHTNGDWEEARTLADAAETAALMDPTTPPGVLAWIYGERSGHRARLGDELGSGRDMDRMEQVRHLSTPEALNVFSPSLGGAWVDNYHVRRALRLGEAGVAVQICTDILSRTDHRLIWQRAEALILLVEAWLLKGELPAAATRLSEAIGLLKSTGNARDLRLVNRTVNGMRQRWGRAPEVRQLDEILRS